MKGKIAIQEGLKQINDKLIEVGYQTVSMEQSLEPVDAIVYSGVTCEWEGGMTIENVEMTTFTNGKEENVVMLNVANMTVEEAVDLIRARVSL